MNLAQMEVGMKNSLYSHTNAVSEDTEHKGFEKHKSRIIEQFGLGGPLEAF